jgi:hypothetical protein
VRQYGISPCLSRGKPPLDDAEITVRLQWSGGDMIMNITVRARDEAGRSFGAEWLAPDMIATVLQHFKGGLTKIGLEGRLFTPHLIRSLAAMG